MRVKGVERYVARKPMPAAVVADVGSRAGLAAIRSLARAGAPVIAVDHRPRALGSRSRHALSILCPDPVADPEALGDFLVELGEALGRPAPIFPADDAYATAIAVARERLGRRFLYPFPQREVLDGVGSKRHRLALAEELAIPGPPTRDEPTDELGFPVLVTASDGVGFRRRFGRPSVRCHSRRELDEVFERARPFDPLVQEIVPGGDEGLLTVTSYLSADGEALAVFAPQDGVATPSAIGTRRRPGAVAFDEVPGPVLALLRALGFHGLSEVELRRDPRDGARKLVDVRPFLGHGHAVAAAHGVDLPRIAYWDLLGARLLPRGSDGGTGRFPVRARARTGRVLGRRRAADGAFAPDDPGPALAQVARLLRGRSP